MRPQIRKGKRFGKWKYTGNYKREKYQHLKIECVCECGTIRFIVFKDLREGKSNGCRCYQNISKHPLHSNWGSMHDRCYNPKNRDFKNYGDKGVKVCKRWHRENRQGFFNFVGDIGKRPSNMHSIDRIDGNKDYSPSNCRWASASEQSNNRKTVKKHKKGHLFGWWSFTGNQRSEKKGRGSVIFYEVVCRCGFSAWRNKGTLVNGKSTKCKSCAMKMVKSK